MNVKRYYRAYNDLLKRYERLSYQIVLKGLKGIYLRASEEYLKKPDTPIELLISEKDTLDILVKIYDGIGIAAGELVEKSLPKQKGILVQIQTKAEKTPPKQYIPTPDDSSSTHQNFWKQEFIRFTQSPDCAAKVKGITNTTRNQIRQIINDSVHDQLSHKQIAKLILDEGGEITTKKRALLIARTENAVGSNLGAMYSAKSSGLVLYKIWVARSGDGRTRDKHVGMIGKDPIPIDSLFDVGGEKMSQPGDSSNGAKGHNICNCRCTVAFIPASEVIPMGTISERKPARKPKINIQPELFDNVIQSITPITPNKGYISVNTLDEATQWVKDNGMGKSVDYTWIKDVKVANEINRVLFNLKDKFNFHTLEQIGGKPSSSSALMSANYRALNFKHSYWKSSKIIKDNYQGINDLAFSERSLKNAADCRRNYEISKNIKWIKKGKDFENEAKFKRWTVNYGEGNFLESTINHEFGHVLHDQLIGGVNGVRVLNEARLNINGYRQMAIELDSEHYLLYGRAKQNGDIYKISAYGSSNNKEFFAETFVMYMAKDPELPIYIVEYFDKLFKLTKI